MTAVGQTNDKDKALWESQFARLGYFLIANSFLVAAFIQLVTTDKELIILIHAIAALGFFTATLYFFMNLWLAIPPWIPTFIKLKESTTNEAQLQLVHTWLIPLAFVAFWSVVWSDRTRLCLNIPIYSFLGLILTCWIFQRFVRSLLKM